jgi:hypothetical protein
MEQIVDFNIYNYSINEMEKLCELKYNYTFSDISLQAQKTKKSIIKTFDLSSMKELEIDIFFQKLTNRLERNLLNRNLTKVMDNQVEIKKIMNNIIQIYKQNK